MPFVYAFCCLIFSSLNDFVFKLYARHSRSRGVFVFWVGIFFYFALVWLPTDNSTLPFTVFWGLFSGFLSVTANILLIEAMGMQSAGLCSTVYRLNLLLVVPGAILLFGEKLSVQQGIGILFALIAIFAFLPKSEEKIGQTENKKLKLGFFLVVLAAVLRALMGLSYKYAFLNGADKNTVSILNAVMWIIGGGLYSVFWEKKQLFKDMIIVKYGFLSGLMVAAIVFFMAGMLHSKEGDAALLLPLAQMSFLLTFVMGVVFLKEKASAQKVFALICGCIAIILLIS